MNVAVKLQISIKSAFKKFIFQGRINSVILIYTYMCVCVCGPTYFVLVERGQEWVSETVT